MKRYRKQLLIIPAVLVWILVWWLISEKVNLSLLVPSPTEVFRRLFELLQTSEFWKATLSSLLRILWGILYSILFGSILALLTANSELLYLLFRPIRTVIKATPVASFIILLILFLDREKVPVIISVLIALPVIWQNVEKAISTLPKPEREMAHIFRIPVWKRFLYLDLPHILPSFSAGVETSVGLAWKAGIAAEVLAMTPISIGKELSEAKTYLETVDLFAWTLTVILLSLLIELLFSYLFSLLFRRKRHKNQGKQEETL